MNISFWLLQIFEYLPISNFVQFLVYTLVDCNIFLRKSYPNNNKNQQVWCCAETHSEWTTGKILITKIFWLPGLVKWSVWCSETNTFSVKKLYFTCTCEHYIGYIISSDKHVFLWLLVLVLNENLFFVQIHILLNFFITYFVILHFSSNFFHLPQYH